VYTGTVNRKEQYGMFVQIQPGITGLLHKSRTQESNDFHFEKIRVGNEVTVQIAEIRANERQISLSLPKDGSEEDDWRSYQPKAQTAGLGTLAERMSAALAAKKK
jgi:small subunit ribosomal protein S1